MCFLYAMKVIKHNLPENLTEANILPLGDLHLGDIHADFHRIREWLDYLSATDNAYAILNGDLMDAAIASSIGDTYGASLQPMEQLKQCVKLFEPIKDKIIAVLPGNHEARIYKTDGLDLTEIMCSQLGISERYSPTSALPFLRFGRHYRTQHGRPVCYTIYCLHGSGGGRKEGGKIQRLVDMAGIVDADIYIMSHVHQPAVVKQAYYRVSAANSSISKVDRLFVNTAAALDYGGYGELQGFKPASTDTPIIRLDGTRKRMAAIL